jgi:hypothetical protein
MTLGEDGEFNDIIYEQGMGNFVNLFNPRVLNGKRQIMGYMPLVEPLDSTVFST